MVKGLTPKRVTRNAGMNPIARAVAREQLRQAITNQKIQLYLLTEGADCAEICAPMLMIFKALIAAAGADPAVGTDNYEVRILRGGVSACEQMITDNYYRRLNTTSLDVALDCAAELNRRVKPELFNQAWQQLAGGG